MLEKVKQALRVKTSVFDDEITGLIGAVTGKLDNLGIVRNGTEDTGSDPMYDRAIILYCKANFGYTEDTEAKRFEESYDKWERQLYFQTSKRDAATDP